MMKQMDSVTDFGQIEIYNQYFAGALPPKVSPSQCIDNKLTYYSLHKGKRLPVMIGSILHTCLHENDNPLGMKGYFIVDGLCKSVSSMYVYDKVLYTEDRAYISSGRVSILSMGKYEHHCRGKKKKWYLPINYELICNYSCNPSRLRIHLDIVASHTNDDLFTSKISRADAYILCRMFEHYIGIRNGYIPPKRLITPGELINDALNLGQDVIKYFRTHSWTVKNIQNVNSVSEDMKHYSMVGDVEAVRRVTFPTLREITRMEDRYINDYERNIFCPVQTSDGVLCGTIMYLCIGTQLTYQGTYSVIPGDKYMLFHNGVYKTQCSNIIMDENTCIRRDDHAIMVWTSFGRIVKGTSSISYAVNFIPFRTHNPAVRSMFTASMIKQAITMDDRVRDGMFNDTKYLIKGEQPLKGQAFPHPAGWNLTVAIMPFFGYNVEDAIVISESASKKYTTEKFSVYTTQLKTSYDKIIECRVQIGDVVVPNDILFKAYHPSEVSTIEIVRSVGRGTISKITSSENCFSVKVARRKPLEVGDKMSSRHGQKGVVSLIVADNDMPKYSDNGKWIHVELILNPHAFPTRKTMGQIKEMDEQLKEVWIHTSKIKSPIYVGKCYYMALRHQVEDKMQFRNVGLTDIITKQAIKGKSRGGGLRIGHMERDILLSVGAHKEIEELFSIDKTDISTCDTCGIIGMASNQYACYHSRYNVKSHQYVIICTALMRANGHDIRYYPKTREYEIVDFDIASTPRINNADEMHFGAVNPLDIRHFYSVTSSCAIPVLPSILRSHCLDSLYTRMFNRGKHNDIFKELKKMLASKSTGAYHNLVEGHRVNHCVRSVIVPNPSIPEDVVELPFGCDIGKSFGILNRQPSLSEQSMMSVKLRVGKNKTLGINPRICQSFNADFDGDEMSVFGIDNPCEKLPIHCNNTQDYIHSDDLHKFTYQGLTCDKHGIMTMIQSGAKGSMTDYKHIYETVGDVIVNGKIEGHITSCYINGLSEAEWFLQAKAGREGASSIGINTPFIGDLNSQCNRLMI